MRSISRRNALRAGSLAVAGGIAGCSGRSPELAAFSLGELTLWNVHEQPHTATVMLLENGEPVYRATLDAEAVEGNQAGGGEFEGYPTEAGRYELYGWHEDAANDEWTRLAFDPDRCRSRATSHPAFN
jgi:hypothetical protein